MATRQAGRIPPPKSERSVTLNFRGDWGRANLHRALGWLGYELGTLFGRYTRIAIWNGRGGLDNIRAVGRGEVDVALATPAAFARMAQEGKGPCAAEAYPHLRALGHVPQHDRLILAVRRDLGIASFEDIRRKKPKLRITTGIDDGETFMGMAAQAVMAASGLPRADIEGWGGSYIEREEPRQCVAEMLAGRADAIFQEAVMTQYWRDMADKLDLAFLPIEPAARDRLAATFGWPSAILPKGYLRGMDRELEFLDFSHFLLVTTTALADDVAYSMAWSLVERWDDLEVQYRHIPPERSPVSYPLDARAACRTPIPLHPGAESYFREAGHL
jgi:hypothetical protein